MIALKRIDEITPANAAPEQALEFVYHHRLRCGSCGIIVQPSDLERTLWVDGVCPNCLKLSNTTGLTERFDSALTMQAKQLESDYHRVKSELERIELEYLTLIEEAEGLTERYAWIDPQTTKLIATFRETLQGIEF